MTPARRRRVATAVLYWLAVCTISLAMVVALVAFLISRDEPSLEPRSPTAPAAARAAP